MRHHSHFASVTSRTLALAILVASLGASSPGVAAGGPWLAEGLAIAPSDSVQSDPVLAPDGHGGAYVAWQDYRPGALSIFAQHVQADGTAAPGWPATGTALANGAAFDPVILADGLGGAFVAAADGSAIHLWHLAPDGPQSAVSFGASSSAVDPAGSISVRSRSAGRLDPTKRNPTVLPNLCSDGAGGAFLAWEWGGFLSKLVLVQHLLPGGGPDPSWPSGGAPAESLRLDQSAPVVCRDGGAGVYVGFLVAADSGIVLRVQHLDARGAIAPGWPLGGLPVTDAAGGQDAPAIVPDAAGGALLLWEGTQAPGRTRLMAQRVDANGTIAPGWPAGGRVVCSQPTLAGGSRYSVRGLQLYTSAVADGAGGAIVAWQDARADSGDLYVQHLTPDGSLAAGWPVDGLALSSAPGTQRLPALAPDGAGGAFVGWQDERAAESANVRAQHVSGSGAIAAGWVAGGVALTGTSREQLLPRVAGDGAGGALLVWQDMDCGAAEILASRVGADGSVPGAHGAASVNVTALGASADSGQIRVRWRLAASASAPALVVVYCRQVDGPWIALDTVAPDGTGQVFYADRGAIAGCRYGYALGLTSCGRQQIQGVTWVDVPKGSGFLPLAVVTPEVQADSGSVRLAWHLNGGEHLQATAFRRDSCSDWIRVGVATVDDSDLVSLVDTSPKYAGTRAQYRLVVHACGADLDLGEWWTAPLTGPGTVPVSASLTRAVADSGTAVLSWRLASRPPDLSTLVERLDPGAGWIARGPATFDRFGDLQFRDTGLLPSQHYEYRLSLFVCGARTTLPSFPVISGAMPGPRAAFAVLAVGPNPAGGALTLTLSVPDDAPVRIELLDLVGRRVLDRRIGPTSTEAPSFVLDGLNAVRPGFYVLRLTQHGVSRSRHVAIVR